MGEHDGEALRDIATAYARSPGILFCIRVGPEGMRFGPVSAPFLESAGLREDEVVGRRVDEVIPADMREYTLARYAEAIRTKGPVRWEASAMTPIGVRTGEVVVTPVFDPEGTCTHLVGTAHDITERKSAEARLALLVNASPVVLYTCSGEPPYGATFLGANVRDAFGYEAREFTSDPGFWADRIHPEDAPRVFAELEQLFVRGTHVHEYRFRSADGTYRWVHDALRVVRDPNGRVVELAGYWADISARRNAEEALRVSEQRKDEFLAVLSHELRNPLAPIRNAIHVLDRLATLDERSTKALRVIDRQTTQLSRLVDDLLDVTRIARGKIRLKREALDFVSVVRHAIADHSAVLAGFTLDVALPDGPLWVDGDAARLAQVVGNLLSNAAKFTPSGGSVRVALARLDGRVRLEVTDSGIGMDRSILERVFEPFAQAERSLDRSRGGLGLGLALVKGLAEEHGGDVHAHSEGPGHGSRFTLELPLGPPPDQVAPRRSEVVAPLPRGERPVRRVLVVEDNPDAASTLEYALQIEGYEVAVAYDGVAGVERARETRPDVVLCDIGLPGMDGYDVARALRSDPATASTYLVAVTGYAQAEDKRRALHAGFDAHLAKPPDLDALQALLAEAGTRASPAQLG